MIGIIIKNVLVKLLILLSINFAIGLRVHLVPYIPIEANS